MCAGEKRGILTGGGKVTFSVPGSSDSRSWDVYPGHRSRSCSCSQDTEANGVQSQAL